MQFHNPQNEGRKNNFQVLHEMTPSSPFPSLNDKLYLQKNELNAMVMTLL